MPAVIMTVTKIMKKLSVREKKAEIGILVVFHFFGQYAEGGLWYLVEGSGHFYQIWQS